jgi:hypothetical protein
VPTDWPDLTEFPLGPELTEKVVDIFYLALKFLMAILTDFFAILGVNVQPLSSYMFFLLSYRSRFLYFYILSLSNTFRL